MMKTRKAVSAIFLVMATINIAFAYCADVPDLPKTHNYEGRIAYINWVTSKMIINGVGQKEFYVPSGTKIRKLGNYISFSDLNILDNAVVNYYEDPSGKNIVVRITITVV